MLRLTLRALTGPQRKASLDIPDRFPRLACQCLHLRADPDNRAARWPRPAKVGIASYEEMKARTVAVAPGKRRIAPNEPKVWFTSNESFAKLLSAGNRELLRVIAEKAPGSLDELARITGKAKSNLSRPLRTMEGYGLVRLERGERGRITPKVIHDRVELDLPLTISRAAS
jgi:predicted transcriptional regulator